MRDMIRTTTRRVPGAIQNRTVSFTLSTEVADRAGDVIRQAGWKLDNYLANPVILWGHDHDIPAIGRMARIGYQGSDLAGDVQFATAEQHPFADCVFRLVEGEIINTGSVGFIPLKWEFRDDGGINWNEQELIEFSICNVPMNPEALAKAVARGIDMEPLARAVGAKNLQHGETYADLRMKLLASNTPKQPPQPTTRLAAEVQARALRLRIAERA